jgi:hypothetical protein
MILPGELRNGGPVTSRSKYFSVIRFGIDSGDENMEYLLRLAEETA